MSQDFDVFLSHNSLDKPTVRRLGEALKRRGLRVWLDEWELPPGQPWQEQVEAIIRTARSAAVLIGKDGLGPWEMPEMRACLTQFVQRKLPVISVLLPGARAQPELPVFLSEFTWVDLRKGIKKEGLDRLEWGITGAKPGEPLPDDASPPSRLPVHNLPFESLGPLFKGRDERLRELAGSQATAIVQKQKQALYGLGGIGKTRLAIEYAWRYGHRYGAILFVGADSPEALRGNLAALARAELLDLPERRLRDEPEVVGAVRRWLRQNPDWLLILDNVDTEEAAQAVEELLPGLSEGHVLVTSRLSRWSAAIREQSLDTISLPEARDFLLERTAGKRQPAGDDEAQAGELARTLGGLPLALEQAAASIAYRHLSLAEYRDQWTAERARVLDWYDPRVMQYPASVAVTWQRTFDELGPASRTILRLAAFLAPDPIPVAMFEGAREIVSEALANLCEETGPSPSPLRLKDALADLAAYSLITWEGKAFSVHRMVQEVMRSRIPEGRKRDWVKWSLGVVNAYATGDPDDVRTWPVWDLIRSHVGRCVEHGDGAGIAEPTSRLMEDLGTLLYAKAVYNESEPLYRRALLIDESSFGAEHPKVAIDLNNLASLLQDTNRLEEAEPLMRRALLIDESSFGAEHPRVAICLNNLAQLLQDTNRLEEAEPLMRRALLIDESSFGAEHPRVAIDLNNLASLLQATNRLEEAEPLMRRALLIFEESLGADHPTTQLVRGKLTSLLAASR